jgi:hypothetical protein
MECPFSGNVKIWFRSLVSILVSFRLVWFRSDWFRFVSIGLVSFRFDFVSHFTGTQNYVKYKVKTFTVDKHIA